MSSLKNLVTISGGAISQAELILLAHLLGVTANYRCALEKCNVDYSAVLLRPGVKKVDL